MPANEILITIYGNTTLALNDYSSGTPSYVVRNTPKLISSLSTRQSKTEKQGDHGVYDSLSFYNERVLPFEGEILGSSQSDRKTKEEALKKCLALPSLQSYAGSNGYFLVTFTDEDSSLKQCYAKIIEPPSFEVLDDTDPSRRGFGFVMMAQDPYLYSQTLNTETGDEAYEGTNFTVVQSVSPTVPFQLYEYTFPSVTCTNNGTVSAKPIIIISDASTSPKVTNATTGLYMLLTGVTLVAGERVEIDVNAKTIIQYDVSDVPTDVSGYLTVDSNWITLAVGSNDLTLLDSTPSDLSATLTVKWRDTYI